MNFPFRRTDSPFHLKGPAMNPSQSAYAASLVNLCRSHYVPARLVQGRKTGALRIRVAGMTSRGWRLENLPVSRRAVREWLGY